MSGWQPPRVAGLRSRLAPAAVGGLGAAALGLALLSPALARSSWWQEAELQVRVHEHAFHRVTANAIGCDVRVRLHFDAPASEYRDPAPERNRYRFLARVVFAENRVLSSEIFENAQVGARVYAFTQDTSDEGCWAEREHALRKVDVHACRGERCVPEPFD